MTEEAGYQGGGLDLEMVFRAFRRSILDEHERALQQLRADWEAEQAIGRRVSDEVRQILGRSNLDPAAMDELRKAENKRMHEYVEEVRRRGLERDPQRDVRLREEAERALGYIQTGWSQPYLIGADMIAETPEQLKGYEGEMGNPSKWLYEANESRRLKAWTTGSAGCVGGWSYCPSTAIWYYAWPATALGKCSVSVWLGYHGFHNLYAIPIPWDFCAYAGVIATAKVQVYQQVSYPKYSKFLGEDEHDVINKYAYGLVSFGILDGSAQLKTDVNITSLSQVYIAVSLSLQVAARGPVSYAELNFQDGAANYVSPPFIAITY